MQQSPPVIPSVLRQHVEGAAFLWSRRAACFHDPRIGEVELGRLDRRLSAHIAGLRASGDAAIVELRARFEDFPERGEAFALFVTALLTGDAMTIGAVLEKAAEHGRGVRFGLSGAIAWAGPADLKEHVKEWAASRDGLRRYLAVAAFSHHRIDPGDWFGRFLGDGDPLVRARALRLIGEVGSVGLVDQARAGLAAETKMERLAAARSLLLLGDRSQALPILCDLAESDADTADVALELAVGAGQGPEFQRWLGGLMRDPARRESAIFVAGFNADATVLDWLIREAAKPESSAAAGRALRLAVDFDFDDTDAFEADPARLGSGFADRDDGPWPVAERVRYAIERHRGTGSFRSLMALRHQCLRAAIAQPGSRLAEWRHRRNYPAWS